MGLTQNSLESSGSDLPLILSADGTRRCARCQLHADTCTCRQGNPVREIIRRSFDDSADPEDGST